MGRIKLQLGKKGFVRRGTIPLSINGQIHHVELSTEGWEKAREDWKVKNPRPKPPVVKSKIVAPESAEGQKLGLDEPEAINEYDREDPKYLAELQDWLDRMHYIITAKALVGIEFEDEAGNVISDNEARAKALQEQGLSGIQAQRISEKLVKLSEISERKVVDFFDGSSEPEKPSGTPPPPTAGLSGSESSPATTGD